MDLLTWEVLEGSSGRRRKSRLVALQITRNLSRTHTLFAYCLPPETNFKDLEYLSKITSK